jgi:ketosteroid isomerase-like protein
MSHENVEVVRAMFDAFTSGDPDGTNEFWDAEGEWRPAMAGWVEDRVYRGHKDLRCYWDELHASFSDVRVEGLELSDLGDRVLALYRLRVRGRDSDLTIDQLAGAVYELRSGKIVRARSYLDQAEAMKAVGLPA